MRRKVIYIAGPYRAATEHGVLMNEIVARSAQADIMRMGAASICPHLNYSRMGGVIPDAEILKLDLEILRRCDAMVLVGDWRRSVGSIGECQFAKEMRIPVFEGMQDLQAWLEDVAYVAA